MTESEFEMYDRQKRAIEGRQARPLLELVNAARFALLYHDEPCHPDHHGYCQTHNLEPVDLCWVPALRKALAALRLTEDATSHKGNEAK